MASTVGERSGQLGVKEDKKRKHSRKLEVSALCCELCERVLMREEIQKVNMLYTAEEKSFKAS